MICISVSLAIGCGGGDGNGGLDQGGQPDATDNGIPPEDVPADQGQPDTFDAADIVLPVCDEDDDCIPDEKCRKGRCEQGKCEYPVVDDGEACDDDDPCTVGDQCQTGECMPGEPMDCDDQDPCTTDSCTDKGDCENAAIPGCVQEICDNKVDDNEDQLIDCDDPHCADDETCKALAVGDTCANPFMVNDGQPVDESMIGADIEYTGDTTDMTDQYSSCGAEPDVRDAVYRLDLAVPLMVTASHDFDGDDPEESPWSVLSVYGDTCFPTSILDCSWGDELAAVLERTWPAGTYFFVVDGDSFWYEDWGPYTLTFAFEAPQETEIDCSDGFDDDGDGDTDCEDEDCQNDPVCDACPVEADLECGDVLNGQFTDIDDEHYYTFKLDEDTDISAAVVPPEGSDDQYNINFKEGPVTLGCDNLYMVSEMVWHSPADGSAGFSAKANEDYVVKLTLSTFDQGAYTITFGCGDGPEQECDDGEDNDNDLYVDCEDPDCFTDDVCSGGHGGDDCSDPFELNDGEKVSLEDVEDDMLEFEHYNTTLGKTNALSAACAVVSAQGPDAVYRFELQDALLAGVIVEFEDFLKEPAVYVFKGDCVADNLVGCGDTFFGIASFFSLLDPGVYHLVVDSNAVEIDGTPHASNFLASFSFESPATTEDCTNGEDEDNDGDTDCEDPECFDDDACTGGKSGEDCDNAIALNGGTAMQHGDQAKAYNTTKGKENDLGGECSPFSQQGPDMVHSFSLDSTSMVVSTVQFDNGFVPALVLFSNGCGGGDQLACETAEWDTATITTTLDPGTYFLVVDSGDALFMEPMSEDYELTVGISAP